MRGDGGQLWLKIAWRDGRGGIGEEIWWGGDMYDDPIGLLYRRASNLQNFMIDVAKLKLKNELQAPSTDINFTLSSYKMNYIAIYQKHLPARKSQPVAQWVSPPAWETKPANQKTANANENHLSFLTNEQWIVRESWSANHQPRGYSWLRCTLFHKHLPTSTRFYIGQTTLHIPVILPCVVFSNIATYKRHPINTVFLNEFCFNYRNWNNKIRHY